MQGKWINSTTQTTAQPQAFAAAGTPATRLAYIGGPLSAGEVDVYAAAPAPCCLDLPQPWLPGELDEPDPACDLL